MDYPAEYLFVLDELVRALPMGYRVTTFWDEHINYRGYRIWTNIPTKVYFMVPVSERRPSYPSDDHYARFMYPSRSTVNVNWDKQVIEVAGLFLRNIRFGDDIGQVQLLLSWTKGKSWVNLSKDIAAPDGITSIEEELKKMVAETWYFDP
jgi:hypothetical protein